LRVNAFFETSNRSDLKLLGYRGDGTHFAWERWCPIPRDTEFAEFKKPTPFESHHESFFTTG